MACVFQFVLAVAISGLLSSWRGVAYPVNSIVQVNTREPTFDMDALNAVASGTNCVYELVDTSKALKTDGDVEWYPKMRPVAKCTSGDCQLVSMRLLFLVKHKDSETHETYWASWDVGCTKSTSSTAKEVEIPRDSR